MIKIAIVNRRFIILCYHLLVHKLPKTRINSLARKCNRYAIKNEGRHMEAEVGIEPAWTALQAAA